jgi:hypothetical protein
MKLLIHIFLTTWLSFFLASNISLSQANVLVLNYSHGKYVGEAFNGKANGQGTYTSKSGVIYQGQFNNDTFSGNGTMIWPNGDKFVGIWNNDTALNGYMTFVNGTSAQGSVRNAIFYAVQSTGNQLSKPINKPYSDYRKEILDSGWTPYIRENQISKWNRRYPEDQFCYEENCQGAFINADRSKIREVSYYICSDANPCPNKPHGFQKVSNDVVVNKFKSDKDFLSLKAKFTN